jgi:hypothetical protein
MARRFSLLHHRCNSHSPGRFSSNLPMSLIVLRHFAEVSQITQSFRCLLDGETGDTDRLGL